MADNMTNGEKPNSQFINHLTSYPLISDTLSIYQKNSLGAKSIEIYNSLYATFATPVIPYLQTPYSIVHPYLVKADSLGDASLAKVDERFPAVKSTDFESLKNTTFSIVHYPFKLAGDGKEYVFKTYSDEYSKTKGPSGQDGIFTTGKAVLSTELRIAAETVAAAWAYIGPKTEEAQKKYEEVKKAGFDKLGLLQKKGEELKANGIATAELAKKKGEEFYSKGVNLNK